MSGRIVLFGATGYTGRFTAKALVERGAAPVLAGRSAGRLQTLASVLGGLETRVADVAVAYDDDGTSLAEIRLDGVDGYTFTARILAWGAMRAAERGLAGTGALESGGGIRPRGAAAWSRGGRSSRVRARVISPDPRVAGPRTGAGRSRGLTVPLCPSGSVELDDLANLDGAEPRAGDPRGQLLGVVGALGLDLVVREELRIRPHGGPF